MIKQDDLITTTEGATLTGYSAFYVRQLARTGRIEARKLGRDWLVSKASLLAFKSQMDALGADKHNPRRQEGRDEPKLS